MTLPLGWDPVLDLTRILAGRCCTMVLGDVGADVIKVEPPGGDGSGTMGPFDDDARESDSDAQVNRNKRGVAPNIEDPRGRDAPPAIAAGCDLVVEDLRPGTTARPGCDDGSIRAIRPDVVCSSISGLGQTGPNDPRTTAGGAP